MFELPHKTVRVPEGKGHDWGFRKLRQLNRQAWLQAVNKHVNSLRIQPLLLSKTGEMIVIVDFSKAGTLQVSFYSKRSSEKADPLHQHDIQNSKLYPKHRYWGLVDYPKFGRGIRIRREPTLTKSQILHTEDLLFTLPVVLPDHLLLTRHQITEIFRGVNNNDLLKFHSATTYPRRASNG